MIRGWKKVLCFLATALLVTEVIASLVTMPAGFGRYRKSASTMLLQGAQVDARVLAILDRSCRDCHSEATRYPWYSYVAPVSVLVQRDVTRGREFLNLSRWNEYSVIRRQRALTGIANQVRNGLMPLDIYLQLHPEARLSTAEEDLVFEWTQAERLRLILESNRAQGGVR